MSDAFPSVPKHCAGWRRIRERVAYGPAWYYEGLLEDREYKAMRRVKRLAKAQDERMRTLASLGAMRERLAQIEAAKREAEEVIARG